MTDGETGTDGIRRRNVRSRDAHTGRGGGGGAPIGHANLDHDELTNDAPNVGAIRSRITDLRATAAMVRSVEPTPTRRLAIQVSRAENVPLSEVLAMTFTDVLYIIRLRMDEAIEAQRAPMPAPRTRYRRGSR